LPTQTGLAQRAINRKGSIVNATPNARWQVSGTYFEACNCESACPCVFLSPPTSGSCTVVVAWHIEQGKFDSTSLDGLNAVLAAHSPGHMLKTKWEVALYLDQRASPPQAEALGKIFSGQAGGHPANLVPFIGKVLGVKAAAIEYEARDKKRALRMGDIAQIELESAAGGDGAPLTLQNLPLCIAPGFPIVVARSKTARFNDLGLTLEVSDKNGFYSPFAYQSA
jgi:hypothetical protein